MFIVLKSVYDKMQVVAIFVVLIVTLFHVIHRGRGPEFSAVQQRKVSGIPCL